MCRKLRFSQKIIRSQPIPIEKMSRVKENNDVDYNDDEYEDIGKVRELKIGQEDEENED